VTPDSLVTFNPLHGAPHNKVAPFKSYDLGISTLKTKSKLSKKKKKVFKIL